MRPQNAARWFFALRFAPFTLALLVIATLCIPSYLRYEDNAGSEGLGLFCLATAFMGLGLLLTSVVRAAYALAQLRRASHDTRGKQTSSIADSEICVAEEDQPGDPLLALVGILRPRLIVSRRLLQALTKQQLEAALLHERAHLLSRDNLKRLLMAVTPGVLPLFGGMASVEGHWQRFAELAADDYAAGGRADRSIALAETLIKVARLANFERPMPLASSLSASNRHLALRVDRLMAVPAARPAMQPHSPRVWRYLFVLFAITGSLAILPKVFYPLYHLLESLLH
jgi:Zn-dependent protease with chaperone function